MLLIWRLQGPLTRADRLPGAVWPAKIPSTNISCRATHFMQISVVIPTYNRSNLTGRAIDSVLQQSRAADEIIVVDDGSTDDTVSALTARYGQQITLIVNRKNSGVSAARNIGIKNSRGDWIALLDSDDTWLPTKLAVQEASLQNRTEPLCHTEEIWIRNGTRVNPMTKHQKHGGDIFDKCLPLCAVSPSSVLIQRDLFNRIGYFDETLPACEDYDLWLRICCQHPVLFVRSPQLIKYGGHADQLSRQHWGMDRFRIQALQKLLNANTLNDKQRQLTVNTLRKKTTILQKGAIKHNNEALTAYCETVLTRYHALNASKPGDSD